MQRSITRYALGGVIIFITVIVGAATSVLFSIQNIAVESTHLSDGIIPWVEANRTYDVAMTSMLGSMQTYLIEYDVSELNQTEAALREADASLQELARIEQSYALTTLAGTNRLQSIQQRRVQIRDATARMLAIFRSSVQTKLSIPTVFASIENIEGELDLLHADQQQLRTSSTQVASAEIAGAFQQTVIVVIAVSTIVLALVGALYVALRRQIAHPLLRLTQATKAIGEGQYTRRLEQGGIAEVGQLQRGFQQMAMLLGQREAASVQQYAELQEAHAKAQRAELHLTEQLQTIVEQREMIRDMSVPLLPIGETTLVMPLIGTLDSERLDTMQSHALDRISRQRTDVLILDVTGVPIIDSHVAQGLLNMVRAARLLGTRIALVGIRPEVAQTIVGLGVDLSEVSTFASLLEGIQNAIPQSISPSFRRN